MNAKDQQLLEVRSHEKMLYHQVSLQDGGNLPGHAHVELEVVACVSFALCRLKVYRISLELTRIIDVFKIKRQTRIRLLNFRRAFVPVVDLSFSRRGLRFLTLPNFAGSVGATSDTGETEDVQLTR